MSNQSQTSFLKVDRDYLKCKEQPKLISKLNDGNLLLGLIKFRKYPA